MGQAEWSHSGYFMAILSGMLIPTVPAGAGVFGRARNRSGCFWW